MRKAFKAGTAGDWADAMNSDRLNAWTSAKLRECYSEVESEDEQLDLQKSTDFLKRIIVPVEGQGGVTLSYVCPHCHCHPLEDYI